MRIVPGGTKGLAFGADGNFYVANQNDKSPLSGQGNVLEFNRIAMAASSLRSSPPATAA